MLLKDRPYIRSKSINIEGVEIKLPPVGQVWNRLSGKYEKRPIIKRSNVKSEQKWDRDDFDYFGKRSIEKKKQLTDSKHLDYDLQRFRKREWDRRLNGVWFYNNGEPMYLTGLYYFYLQWWPGDAGYLDFRITDWETFLLWDHIERDENALGLILASKRRQGKTAKSGVIIYEPVSRSKNVHGGIQSKTDDDARDVVFREAVVNPFTELPDFFKPTYDTGGGVIPKNDLIFKPTMKKGGSIEDLDSFLGGSIGFKSSKVNAYDGKKLFRYISDECGKLSLASIYDRHQVVVPTAKDDNTGKFVGKMFYPTTVEDPLEGGENFQKLWEDSDQTKIDPNTKQTKTGLYRLFLPAYRCYNYDDYGYPDEVGNKRMLLAQREVFKNEPDKLVGLIRKDPFTIEEAFFANTKGCLYDAVKINNRIQELSWVKEEEYLFRGNLIWKDGIEDSEVEFKEASNGRFAFSKRVASRESSDWNLVELSGTKKRPLNDNKIIIGVDPFDNDVTVDNRRSDGAIYGYHKFDITSDLSETFLFEYLSRPPKAEMFYEDVIKACHFFGCKAIVENNRIGCIKYMERRGYSRFLVYPNGEKKPAGISATTKTHGQLADETERYVMDQIQKVDFIPLLKDWLNFDIKDTQKFDAAMGSGWALVGASEKRLFRRSNQYENKTPTISHKNLRRLL